MDRTVNVIENLDGKKTVIIQDIRFRGKRNINWTDVERYLVEFIGDIYYIAENNNEENYIGRDLPSEYTGSMSFMQVYLSGMRRMEENIFMIL